MRSPPFPVPRDWRREGGKKVGCGILVICPEPPRTRAAGVWKRVARGKLRATWFPNCAPRHPGHEACRAFTSRRETSRTERPAGTAGTLAWRRSQLHRESGPQPFRGQHVLAKLGLRWVLR